MTASPVGIGDPVDVWTSDHSNLILLLSSPVNTYCFSVPSSGFIEAAYLDGTSK